jgi:hypothetical protein
VNGAFERRSREPVNARANAGAWAEAKFRIDEEFIADGF